MAHHSLTPEGRGFDNGISFFGHGPDYFTSKKGKCDGRMMTDLWHNGAPAELPYEYVEDLFKAEAIRTIPAGMR